MTAEVLPLEHVERPVPPWRVEVITECGRPVADFAVVISRDDLIAKVRSQGIQRASLTTCMNCLHTAKRWQDWAHNPSDVVARDVHGQRGLLLATELRALGLLYEAHREEYEEILAGLQATVDLQARRRKRA